MKTLERLDAIEASLDQREYRHLLPCFISVTTERQFRGWHASRCPDSDMQAELIKHNRGEKVWLGLFRAVFLPDSLSGAADMRKTAGALYDALKPFGLKMAGDHPKKCEIELDNGLIGLAHVSHIQPRYKEYKAASDKFFETAKQFGIKF